MAPCFFYTLAYVMEILSVSFIIMIIIVVIGLLIIVLLIAKTLLFSVIAGLIYNSEGIVDEFLCRDPHYTFIENVPPTAGKRNPHLFVGEYITITRRDDGSLRPNFKPMKIGADFSVEKYAAGVANELLWALEGLIENGLVEEESE